MTKLEAFFYNFCVYTCFMKPPIPKDEPRRLEALRDLEIIDTQSDPFFERLVLLASQILKTPITLISLVEAERQWFMAKTGLDLSETSREVSFCAHAIHSNDPFIVEDATCDDRFSQNALVTGKPEIRFYAGAPLVTPEGYRLGTLCAIDNKPRKADSINIAALQALAALASEAIRLKNEIKSLNKLSSENSNNAKASFVDIAEFAHELRSPLGVISGFAELIEDDRENLLSPEKYRYFASNIRESAQHLFRLADRIARTEKMLHGGGLDIERVEVKNLIDFVILSFEGMAADKSQKIIYNSPGLDVFVMVDQTALRQILINLISNACKYSQEGASITVTLLSSQDKCTIEVADNGPGIPDDVLSELGKPFLKSQNNIREDGIGLGLSITLNLARSMNWELEIFRGLNGGTVARIDTCPKL